MFEIWKPVPDYVGIYICSNLGRIKTLRRIRKTPKGGIRAYPEKILKGSISPAGYITVTLCNFKVKYFSVHRLIAITFIPNPENLPVVNHKDGNKLNNKIDNLEWCTSSYNSKHAHINGLQPGSWDSLNNPNCQPVINNTTGEIYGTVKAAYKSLSPDFGIDTFRKKIKNKKINYSYYETKTK